MKLHPAQKKVVEDTHRFRVVNAGRRFGKSIMAVEELLFNAVKKEAIVAYCAPTYLQAREIAWAILKKRVQDFSVVSINDTRLEMIINNSVGSTSKITLKGWESVESLRGQSFDFLVLDEVAMYRDFRTGWEEIVRPTLLDRNGSVLFISTPKGFNFWYDLYNMESRDKDYKSFHFTAYDNPYLSKGELDKTKTELTEDRFAQEILADFRKTEGLVYKEFNRSRHVFSKQEGKAFVKTFGGLDFGFTNPCAAITIKKDRFAVYWVTDEWYKTQQTDAQIADYVQALKWDECYPDPESPAAIEELKKRGVNVREVVKNKDSIKNGINVVRELFKTNRLRIHESCKNLILELETYSYPEPRPDRNEDENPIKEGDHACDALRYALTMDNALTVEQFHPVISYQEPDHYNPSE